MKIVKAMLLILSLLALPQYVGATASDFNATTSIVTITQQVAINSNVFTFGCWTYREGSGEGTIGRIVDKRAVGGWTVYVGDANTNYSFDADWSTTDGDWDIALPALNTWVHFAVSYDFGATTNDPTFYFDGVEQTETEDATPVGTEANGADDLTIGNLAAATRTWDGKLADCFFYNHILTANEIKQIMRFGPPSLDNGLIGYWPLGAFTGFNYTSTTGLDGTPTALTVSNIGPPVNKPQVGLMP